MTEVDTLALSKRERELQTDVCEMEWPSDAGEQFTIMQLVSDFMEETRTSKSRTAAIIGWPRKTLADRQERFRRSSGERLGAGTRQHGPANDQIAKAQRVLKANPEAVLADPAVVRKVEAALEPEPIAPLKDRRPRIEDVAPGEILLLEFNRWYLQGKSLMRRAQESGRLNKAGRDELEEIAQDVRNLVDFIVSGATSGNWDEELASMLEGD